MRVWRPNGQPLFDQRFTADALTTLCADGLCRLNLAEQGVRLREGRRYTWRVIAMLPDEAAPVRSERRGFVVGNVEASIPSTLPYLIYANSFEYGLGSLYTLQPESTVTKRFNDFALKVETSGQMTALWSENLHHPLPDFSLQLAYQLPSGALRLSVDSYAVTVEQSGSVTLFRAGLPQHNAAIPGFDPSQWHHIQFSGMAGNLQLTVDGLSVFVWQDSSPLPASRISFTPMAMAYGALLIDDIRLWADILPQPPMQGVLSQNTYTMRDYEYFVHDRQGSIFITSKRSTHSILTVPQPFPDDSITLTSLAHPTLSHDGSLLGFRCTVETGSTSQDDICVIGINLSTMEADLASLENWSDTQASNYFFGGWSPNDNTLTYLEGFSVYTQSVPGSRSLHGSLNSEGQYISQLRWGKDGGIYVLRGGIDVGMVYESDPIVPATNPDSGVYAVDGASYRVANPDLYPLYLAYVNCTTNWGFAGQRIFDVSASGDMGVIHPLIVAPVISKGIVGWGAAGLAPACPEDPQYADYGSMTWRTNFGSYTSRSLPTLATLAGSFSWSPIPNESDIISFTAGSMTEVCDVYTLNCQQISLNTGFSSRVTWHYVRPGAPQTVEPLGHDMVFVGRAENGDGTDIFFRGAWSEDYLPLTNAYDTINAYPVLSPDGSRVAFESTDLGEDWSIYMKLNDPFSPPQPVASDARQPVWSPDSTRLAFVRSSGIYAYTLSTYEEYLLHEHGSGTVQHLSWSPNGRWIVYAYNDALYYLDANCQQVPPLTCPAWRLTPTTDTRTFSYPAWSPNGTRLAAVVDGRLHIGTVPFNTSVQPPVPAENSPHWNWQPAHQSPGNDSRPAWSQDGSTLVFESKQYAAPSIYRVTVDSLIPVTAVASTSPTLELVRYGGQPHLLVAAASDCISYPVSFGKDPNFRDYPSTGSSVVYSISDRRLRLKILNYYDDDPLRPPDPLLPQLIRWWLVELVDDVDKQQGWMWEGSVDEQGCDTNIQPTDARYVDPAPAPGVCVIQVNPGTIADITDGSTNHVLTNFYNSTTMNVGNRIGDDEGEQNLRFVVYGISGDKSKYLISPIGADQPLYYRPPGLNYSEILAGLPSNPAFVQNWVTTSLFMNVSDRKRACDPGVLGIVPNHFIANSVDVNYTKSLAFYINNFLTPIDRDDYYDTSRDDEFDVVYPAFRVSQYATDRHPAVDIVYKPPAGNERTDTSTDFNVYAPYSGLIVEAGPDSITGTEIFIGSYDAFPFWIKSVCPQDNDKTCFPLEDSYLVWFYQNRNGEWELMVALRHDTDASDATGMNELINGVANPLSPVVGDFWVSLAENRGLRRKCHQDNGSPKPYGCSDGPGRQLVVWHEAHDGDADPDIQTTYVHLDMDQYNIWRAECSVASRPFVSRRAVWNAAPGICQIAGKTRLGVAKNIGFTTGVHLHYAVSIDRSNDPDDNNVFDRKQEEIDPTIAVDFHMQPGLGGID